MAWPRLGELSAKAELRVLAARRSDLATFRWRTPCVMPLIAGASTNTLPRWYGDPYQKFQRDLDLSVCERIQFSFQFFHVSDRAPEMGISHVKAVCGLASRLTQGRTLAQTKASAMNGSLAELEYPDKIRNEDIHDDQGALKLLRLASMLDYAFVSSRDSGGDLGYCLSTMEVECERFFDMETAHALCRDRDERPDLLFVDADSFGGPASVVSSLLKFRCEFPKTAIILASSTLKESDFSTERLPICDASLKVSVDPLDLAKAVMVALANNLYYTNSAYPIHSHFITDTYGFDSSESGTR